MREAGLEVSRDEAGNLFGRRGEARVWAGSHLDSVPTAGRFDGALGVVAAIEAAARLPDAPLAVVAFRAEETGPMGSRRLDRRSRTRILELHIEQGPVLALARRAARHRHGDRGPGARRARSFEGRADHAGTTPMDARPTRSSRRRASSCTCATARAAGTVATVGAIEVEPNATNVVPGARHVSVDARVADAAALDALIAAIGFEPDWRLDPVRDERRVRRLRAARTRPSSSRAPATTRWFWRPPACRPRCSSSASLNGGISHHPDELSSEEDIALAVDALTAALDRLTR